MRIAVDGVLRAKLRGLDTHLELCDESGHVVGYFTPAADRSIYEGVKSPTSDDELDQRSRQGGGRPLREILDNLERRGQ
jgi:hypothetical protein